MYVYIYIYIFIIYYHYVIQTFVVGHACMQEFNAPGSGQLHPKAIYRHRHRYMYICIYVYIHMYIHILTYRRYDVEYNTLHTKAWEGRVTTHITII